MLRSFNYTGRKRIGLADCSFRLRSKTEGPLEFDADLDFSSLGLPDDAKVYVEAYYQTTWQQFDCGTVALTSPPKEQSLIGFEPNTPVMFRIKVVDESGRAGRILAAADRIRPIAEDDDRSSEPLLDVSYTDIGKEIWRIRWEGDHPILEMNNKVPNHEHIVRRDPLFHAFVLPAAFREILFRQIVFHNALEQPEGTAAYDWLEYGAALAGERLEGYDLGEEEKVDKWVDNAVERFSGDNLLRDNLIKKLEEI